MNTQHAGDEVYDTEDGALLRADVKDLVTEVKLINHTIRDKLHGRRVALTVNGRLRPGTITDVHTDGRQCTIGVSVDRADGLGVLVDTVWTDLKMVILK